MRRDWFKIRENCKKYRILENSSVSNGLYTRHATGNDIPSIRRRMQYIATITFFKIYVFIFSFDGYIRICTANF